jgi:hypothetical protein
LLNHWDHRLVNPFKSIIQTSSSSLLSSNVFHLDTENRDRKRVIKLIPNKLALNGNWKSENKLDWFDFFINFIFTLAYLTTFQYFRFLWRTIIVLVLNESQVIFTFLAKWTIYIMIEENIFWTNVEYFFSLNHSILFIVLLSSRFDADSDLSLSFNLDQLFGLTDQNTEKEIWISFRL